MPIAFYAPLKPPNHQVPSGDRQMGRLLLLALERAGFAPALASSLRIYLPKGDEGLGDLQAAVDAEVQRLLTAYGSSPETAPQLWFTYHSYYKSPDLVGPAVARALQIPYVTAEASHAPKRADGPWAKAHRINQDVLRRADLNFYFTERDRQGLTNLLGGESKVHPLPPFLDVDLIPERTVWQTGTSTPARLLTVAMMRPGVKLKSYQMLAQALNGLEHLNWSLDIVGDGETRPQVEQAFAPLSQDRLTWHGRLTPPEIAPLYGRTELYVWPGFEEAYGMAFLEAQAAGLATVAQNTGGIPSVVQHGETGLLTPEGDVDAFGATLERLIENREQLATLGRNASQFVRRERSVERASLTLKAALETLL
ncbi:MAG: glycosyltransferase family 4 protein [Alphaproteobacteria bacterium]|nr:glycosyltransferase family 4 protein [Alphaproteobacteria bacterium]